MLAKVCADESNIKKTEYDYIILRNPFLYDWLKFLTIDNPILIWMTYES